ncbi:MAG: PEP-CTERM sorting domain-containing protein [Rubrivivax sp.]
MKLPSTLAAAALLAVLAAPAAAAEFVFDFSNLYSSGVKGDGENTTLSFELGAGARITGFSWTVDVSTFGESWLSEVTLDFTNNLGAGVQFSPAMEVYAPGSQSSSGSLNLVNAGQSFALGNDGKLYLEFYESYDDIAAAPDARWNHGTLTFQLAPVPEPSSYAMLGLGLLAVGAATHRRRRRSAD